MKTLLQIAGLFAQLTLLVGAAAVTGDGLYGLVDSLRPYRYDDISFHIVQAGMIVTVALVGWVLARRCMKR